MCLNEIELKQKVIIRDIVCDDILKNRLFSFGIIEDTQVEITAKSFAKKTIEIKVNQSKIALRSIEASKIKVYFEK